MVNRWITEGVEKGEKTTALMEGKGRMKMNARKFMAEMKKIYPAVPTRNLIKFVLAQFGGIERYTKSTNRQFVRIGNIGSITGRATLRDDQTARIRDLCRIYTAQHWNG